MKKILPVLLACLLAVVALPGQAWAIDYPSPTPSCPALVVPGWSRASNLSNQTYYLVNESGQPTIDNATKDNFNLYYDDDTKTLIMKDAKLQGALYIDGGTTIELQGENTSGSEERKVSIGIQGMTSGPITITGEGSYTVYSSQEGIATVQSNEKTTNSDIIIKGKVIIDTKGTAISSRHGNISIDEEATVTAGTISCGLANDAIKSELTIDGKAKVKAENLRSDGDIVLGGQANIEVVSTTSSAINPGASLTVADQAQVSATGKTGAISAFYGSVTIEKEASVNASVTDKSRGYSAISMGLGDVQQSNTMTICGTVTSDAPLGLASSNGDIVVDGGRVIAQNVTVAGILAQQNDITIKNGARIEINGGTAGVTAQQGNIHISGSNVMTKASSLGISASKELILENSTVTISANTKAFNQQPTLTYTDLYKVTAGEAEENAVEIAKKQLTADTFANKYVKIEPKQSVPATSLALDQESLTLYDNIEPKSATLTAKLEPTNTTDEIVWTSDAPDVATVDENGVVTAVAGGTATITATAREGLSAACKVTVSTYSPAKPTYDITQSVTDGGKISLSHKFATAGAMVTISVEPDDGYVLDGLSVADSKGNAVKLTKRSDSRYSFKMPKGGVSIAASFTKSEPQPEPQPEPTELPFTDVNADAWYIDPVRFVYSEGLMTGTSATEFSPNLTTTRGMIVAILYRMEGEPDLSNENLGYPFADVDASAYYGDAVYWARLHGIVSGYSSESFGPTDSITREQLAAILYNYAEYKGVDTSASNDLSAYTDAGAISGWATDAMQWANAEGLVNGMSESELAPKGNATRAQVAAMLQRYVENILP